MKRQPSHIISAETTWKVSAVKQVRTDLAMESLDGRDEKSLPGVHLSNWETGGVRVTEVNVSTKEGAALLHKPVGHYITLESEGVKQKIPQARQAMSNILGEELGRLLPKERKGPVMVIGLGNRMVTPDALGPLTVDHTLVTRHLFSELPDRVDDRMRSVCALAPGVLGVTGIETMEMVRAVVQAVKPCAVVAVDSLSARAVSRVGCAVQLTDTGIQPGSGVGNRRMALSVETLGVPVLALGVPMVIYAATIARDAFELLSGARGDEADGEALDQMSDELLRGAMGEMIVTPREVDDLVHQAALMLSGGVNRALHPDLSDLEIARMMS